MKKIFEIIENFNFKSWVLFCISLSILLRFAIVIYFPDQNYLTYSDQSKYIYRSNLILSGIFFSEEWGVLRMPGYPIFLSIIKLFFNNFFFIILIHKIFYCFLHIITSSN